MSIEPAENQPPGRRLVPVHGHDPNTGQAGDAAERSAPDTAQTARQVDDKATDAAPGHGRLAGALGVVVGVSLAAVIVAPVTLSATHLIKWASSAAGLGLPIGLAWLVFVALDLAAVTCIGMVVLCAMKGEGAGAFSLATWGFAFASAFANYTGGKGAGQWFFPAMSLAGPALLEMVLSKVKRWARISEGTQLSARPKFGVRWVPGIAFRETARAWAAARRENIVKAADAIAFVREVDVLAKMSDTDAVRYATAAVGTQDAYALRQWLTSRGKDVAQDTLPALPVAVTMTAEQIMDDDITREGGSMSAIFAPMPGGLRAPREALGLPAAPKPRPRPRQTKSTVTELPPRRVKGDPTSNPKWAAGVAAYRKSVDDRNPMSQRELADYLGMKNRTLAAQIIAHVRNERRES